MIRLPDLTALPRAAHDRLTPGLSPFHLKEAASDGTES